MTHIHKTTMIDAPIDKVYAFARDPNHWSDWYVGLREPEEIIGDGGPGTVVKHHYHMAGTSFAVTTKVTEQKDSPKEAIHKLTFDGLLSGKQQVAYKANGDKTEVTLDIDYTVPGKALGRIADKLVIERLQEKAMEHTLENLKIVNEAAVHAPAMAR